MPSPFETVRDLSLFRQTLLPADSMSQLATRADPLARAGNAERLPSAGEGVFGRRAEPRTAINNRTRPSSGLARAVPPAWSMRGTILDARLH